MINYSRIFLVICFINWIGLTSYAQFGIEISNQHKPVGKNHRTNEDIIAKEIVFPETIYKTYIDTTSNCITVQLRYLSPAGKITHNTGNIVVYDLKNEKEKWSKKNQLFTNVY